MCYAALFGLFFLMPFVLVRAYGDSTFAAGLRLTVLPVMLGVVAPLAGALYDRLGPRLLTVSGMLICVAALALLFAALDGAPARLPAVTLALALFGPLRATKLLLSPHDRLRHSPSLRCRDRQA
jgi:nitrate/nitrite transporter NarK